MLKIEQLNVGYGALKILEDINIDVRAGECVALIGPNGSGKTTLLRTIMGFQKPLSGKVIFLGKDITGLKPFEIVKMGICLIPERRRLFSEFSVLENLEMGAFLIKNEQEKKERFEFVFKLFPVLKERKNQLARTLSGGQQQILACARGLVMNPKLLVLDEPSVGLAPVAIETLYNTLKSLREHGLPLFCVEQNVNAALSIADRVYVISTGKIVAEGTVKDIVNNELVLTKFLTMA